MADESERGDYYCGDVGDGNGGGEEGERGPIDGFSRRGIFFADEEPPARLKRFALGGSVLQHSLALH